MAFGLGNGCIRLTDHSIDVTYPGWFSSTTIFSVEERIVGRATRFGILRRRFELTTDFGSITIEPTTPCPRSSRHISGENTDATIAPTKWFGYRSKLEGRCCSFEISAMCFWLTIISWYGESSSG
jgi:hypothetical protein